MVVKLCCAFLFFCPRSKQDLSLEIRDASNALLLDWKSQFYIQTLHTVFVVGLSARLFCVCVPSGHAGFFFLMFYREVRSCYEPRGFVGLHYEITPYFCLLNVKNDLLTNIKANLQPLCWAFLRVALGVATEKPGFSYLWKGGGALFNRNAVLEIKTCEPCQFFVVRFGSHLLSVDV